MPPCRGTDLPTFVEAFLDDPHFVCIAPMSPADTIRRGHNFNRGFEFKVAHKVEAITPTQNPSGGPPRRHTANAAVIALQFQNLAEEEPARKLAFEHPNLSVYASDAAVIGGIPGQWRLGDLPKNWGEIRSSFWGKRGSADAFLLGDFASFSRFCALSYSPDLAHPSAASVSIDGTDPTEVSA